MVQKLSSWFSWVLSCFRLLSLFLIGYAGKTGLLAVWLGWSVARWPLTSWLFQADGKWVIVLEHIVWRAPYLCQYWVQRGGHDHDCSSLKLTKPEKPNSRCHSICHRKDWTWLLKSRASLKEMHLWNLFDFILFLWKHLFFPDFPPFTSRSVFSFSCHVSFFSISMAHFIFFFYSPPPFLSLSSFKIILWSQGHPFFITLNLG